MKWAFYLVLMVVWMIVAIGLWFFPTVLLGPRFLHNRDLLAIGATILVVWNMTRAWANYSAGKDQPRTRELREQHRTRYPREPEKPVLNPEFNFDAQTPIPEGPPSSDGDPSR